MCCTFVIIVRNNPIQLQENIQAKRETYGNYDSMVLLLDCLKRRENWPEEFITALVNCGHPTMAAEIAHEYDALKGSKSDSICPRKCGFQWPPGFTGLNQARPPEAVVTCLSNRL